MCRNRLHHQTAVLQSVPEVALLATCFALACGVALGAPTAETTPATTKPPRIAICGFATRGASEQVVALGKNLTDLTFANLTADRDIQLIEREQIQQVLKELKLSVQAFSDPAMAVKAGQMMGADLLVFGAHFRQGSNDVVVVKVVAAPSTEVRELAVVPLRSGGERAVATRVAALVRHALLPRPPGQDVCFVGVGSFLPVGAMPLFDDLHERIYLHLTDAYAKRPGVALLERTDLDWLMTERQLADAGFLGAAGMTNVARVASILVYGQYALQRLQSTEINVRLQVQDTGGRRYDVNLAAESVEDLLPKILQTLDGIITARQHSPAPAPPTAARDVEIAAHLKRLPGADAAQARKVWESILLLDPQHEQARLSLGRIMCFQGNETPEDPVAGCEMLQALKDGATDEKIRFEAATVFWQEDEVPLSPAMQASLRNPAAKRQLFLARARDSLMVRGRADLQLAPVARVEDKFGQYIEQLCREVPTNAVEAHSPSFVISGGMTMDNRALNAGTDPLDLALLLFVAAPELAWQKQFLQIVSRQHPQLAPYFAMRLWSYSLYGHPQAELDGWEDLLTRLGSGEYRPWDPGRFYGEVQWLIQQMWHGETTWPDVARRLYTRHLMAKNYAGCSAVALQALRAFRGTAAPPEMPKEDALPAATRPAGSGPTPVAAVTTVSVLTNPAPRSADVEALLAGVREMADFSYDAMINPRNIRHLLLPYVPQDGFRPWMEADVPKLKQTLRALSERAPGDEEVQLYNALVQFYAGSYNDTWHDRSERGRGWETFTNLMQSASDERIRLAAGLAVWRENGVAVSDARKTEMQGLACQQAIWAARLHMLKTGTGATTGPWERPDRTVGEKREILRGVLALCQALSMSTASNAEASAGVKTALDLLAAGHFDVFEWRQALAAMSQACPAMTPYFEFHARIRDRGCFGMGPNQGVISGVRKKDRPIWNPACFCSFLVEQIEQWVADDAHFSAILPACQAKVASGDLDGCLALVSSVLDSPGGDWVWTPKLTAPARSGAAPAPAAASLRPVLTLKGHIIVALGKDTNGDILLLTSEGRLGRWTPGGKGVSYLPVSANLRPGWEMIESGEWSLTRPAVFARGDSIWVATGTGMFEYTKSTGAERMWGAEQGLIDPRVGATSLSGDRLWLVLPAARGGYIDLKARRFIGVPAMHSSLGIATSANGNVWQMTQNTSHALYLFHPDTLETTMIGQTGGKGARTAVAASPWYVVTGIKLGLTSYEVASGRVQDVILTTDQQMYMCGVGVIGNVALVAAIQDAWLVGLEKGDTLGHWQGLGEESARPVLADGDRFWLGSNENLYEIELSTLGMEAAAYRVAGTAPNDPVTESRTDAAKLAENADRMVPEERVEFLLEGMNVNVERDYRPGSEQIVPAAEALCAAFAAQADPKWHRRNLAILTAGLDKFLGCHPAPQEFDRIGRVLKSSASPYLQYVYLSYFHTPMQPARVLAEGELAVLRLEETLRFCRLQKESWFTDRRSFLLRQISDAYLKVGDRSKADAALHEAETVEKEWQQRVLGSASEKPFVEQHMVDCQDCRQNVTTARGMNPLAATKSLDYRKCRVQRCQLAQACESVRVATIQPEAVDPWLSVDFLSSAGNEASTAEAQVAVQQTIRLLRQSSTPWAPFYALVLETGPSLKRLPIDRARLAKLIERCDQSPGVWPCNGMAETCQIWARQCSTGGNHTEAARCLLMATRFIGPSDDEFHPNRACCEAWLALAGEYRALGQRDKALEAVDKSCLLDRRAQLARQNLSAYVAISADAGRIVRVCDAMFGGVWGRSANNLNYWSRDVEPSIPDPRVLATCYEHCASNALVRSVHSAAKGDAIIAKDFRSAADLARDKAAKIRASVGAGTARANLPEEVAGVVKNLKETETHEHQPLLDTRVLHEPSFVEKHMAKCGSCQGVIPDVRLKNNDKANMAFCAQIDGYFKALPPMMNSRTRTADMCEFTRGYEFIRIATNLPQLVDPWSAIKFMAVYKDNEKGDPDIQSAIQQTIALLKQPSGAVWGPFYAYVLETAPFPQGLQNDKRLPLLLDEGMKTESKGACLGIAELRKLWAKSSANMSNHVEAVKSVPKSPDISNDK